MPNSAFVEQKENFLFMPMDPENKHKFNFVALMKQKLDDREKSLQSQ